MKKVFQWATLVVLTIFFLAFIVCWCAMIGEPLLQKHGWTAFWWIVGYGASVAVVWWICWTVLDFFRSVTRKVWVKWRIKRIMKRVGYNEVEVRIHDSETLL